jgi:hypothetical protein
MTQLLSVGFKSANFLGGRAPARPKNFGTAGAVPSNFSPNEFGAREKFVINFLSAQQKTIHATDFSP